MSNELKKKNTKHAYSIGGGLGKLRSAPGDFPVAVLHSAQTQLVEEDKQQYFHVLHKNTCRLANDDQMDELLSELWLDDPAWHVISINKLGAPRNLNISH